MSRPDDVGGSLFGLVDQYRRITKFGVDVSKLTNSKYYRASLYWTEPGQVGTTTGASNLLVAACNDQH